MSLTPEVPRRFSRSIRPDGLTNHKAGWIGFGPDGDLYIATGDGGGRGDPNGNGQNLNTLLGKMLRLDVHGDDFPADTARNYAIPADNPFVGVSGEDEIWAFGLRNPFRNSFDRALGTLFIADVGQNSWEEIDIGKSGANYGWNIFEGPARLSPGTTTRGTETPPIFSYDHSVGTTRSSVAMCTAAKGKVCRVSISLRTSAPGTSIR